MEKVRFFQRSMLSTDCDACGGRVDLVHGGACDRCRRILCFRHLYGSWFQRLRTEFGAPTRCVECRRSPAGRVVEAGRDPAPAGRP